MNFSNNRWLAIAISCIFCFGPYIVTSANASSISFSGPISLTYTTSGNVITKYYSTIQAAIDAGALLGPGVYVTVHVPPGTYTEKITMKSFVALEGAGIRSTTITCDCGSTAIDAFAATLTGAENSEVRDIFIINAGGDDYSLGVYNSSSEFHLYNTRIDVKGGTTENRGIHHEWTSGLPILMYVDRAEIASHGNVDNTGVYVEGSGADLRIKNSTITTQNGTSFSYGVRIAGDAEVGIWNSEIDVRNNGTNAYGINSEAGDVSVYQSKVWAADASAFNIAIYNESIASAEHSVLYGSSHTIYHDTALAGFYAYNQLGTDLTSYTNSATYGGAAINFSCIGNYSVLLVAKSC